MCKRSLYECKTKSQAIKELLKLYYQSFNGEKNIYASHKCFLENVVNDLKDPNCQEDDKILKQKCRKLLMIVKTFKNSSLYLFSVTLFSTVLSIFNLIRAICDWSIQEDEKLTAIVLLLVIVIIVVVLFFEHYKSRCIEYVYEILSSDERFVSEEHSPSCL